MLSGEKTSAPSAVPTWTAWYVWNAEAGAEAVADSPECVVATAYPARNTQTVVRIFGYMLPGICQADTRQQIDESRILRVYRCILDQPKDIYSDWKEIASKTKKAGYPGVRSKRKGSRERGETRMWSRQDGPVCLLKHQTMSERITRLVTALFSEALLRHPSIAANVTWNRRKLSVLQPRPSQGLILSSSETGSRLAGDQLALSCKHEIKI